MIALRQSVEALGLRAEEGASLAKLGYWRIGGPADLYVECPNTTALAGVLRLGAPITVIGNGSNLLVSDRGIRGLTVRLTGQLRDLHVEDGVAVAGAGLSNAVLLRRLEALGLGGLGCLAGVPGTVGGAIRLNAGTALGEIGARTERVEVLMPGGERVELSNADCQFSYRYAGLPAGVVVTRAWFRVDADGFEVEKERMAWHLARRKATQPLELPSCGSVFKNPDGEFAGRLIERCGLKGTRLGGAQISDRHANFIVNTGGATAADVLALMRLARDTVLSAHSVRLEPEVHAVGDFEPGEWPI